MSTVGHCVYCSSNESHEIYSAKTTKGDSFSFRRCHKCDSVFIGPLPTAERLAQAYDDTYYGESCSKFYPLIETVLNRFRGGRASYVMRHVQPPSRILDIGCGRGTFIKYLIQKGYEGHAIELPGKAAAAAQEIPNLRLKLGALAEADYPRDYFDFVTLWHVFEHLSEPKKLLTTVARILKPGGYLALSIPNVESLQSRLFRGHWFHLDPPRHLVLMNKTTLTSELTKFGFDVIQWNCHSIEQNPFGVQQSILNCILPTRDALYESLKGNKRPIRGWHAHSLAVQKVLFVATFPMFWLAASLESLAGFGGTMEFTCRKIS